MPAQRRKTSADGSTPKRAVAAPPPQGQRRCQATHCSTSSRTPPPAGAEAIAPRLVPHRPAQQRPRRAEAIDTALSGMISATQRPRTGRGDRRARTSGGGDSRRLRIRRGDHRQPVRRHPDGLPCAEGLALPFQNRGRPKPLPTEAGGFRAAGNVRGSRDTRTEDRPRESNLRQLFPEFLHFTVKVTWLPLGRG